MPREDSFVHPLIFSIIFLLLTVLTGHFFDSIYLNKYIEIPGPVFITELLQIFFSYACVSIGCVLSFKFLANKENYEESFKIVAYSFAVLPFQFIPFSLIPIIASIYWIHICIRGGQFVYNLSYWKSCFIVLIGSLVFPILLAFLIIDITLYLWNWEYSINFHFGEGWMIFLRNYR